MDCDLVQMKLIFEFIITIALILFVFGTLAFICYKALTED